MESAKLPNNYNHSVHFGEKLSSKSAALLDTSAQSVTDTENQSVARQYKRAIAKYKTNQVIYKLVDLKSSLHDYYWRSWHCNNILLQKGNVITGHYCNGRACIVCGRIRTAKLIEGYLPVIKTFKEAIFQTLTIPSVKGTDLKAAIEGMNIVHHKIVMNLKKKRGLPIRGIRKLEVNPERENADHDYRDTFTPHTHQIVDGMAEAEAYRKEWLKHYPEAYEGAQDIRPAVMSSLIELFKYTTKLVAEDSGDAAKLDIIFRALYNKRCIQPVGIKKYVSEDIDEIQSEEIEGLKYAIDTWTWNQGKSDWFNPAGEGLTGCQEYKRKPVIEEVTHPAPDSCRSMPAFNPPLAARNDAIDTFEAGKKQTFRKIDGLNNSQIFDYPNENLEIDVLYQVGQEISKS
jgi:hypothetical protein